MAGFFRFAIITGAIGLIVLFFVLSRTNKLDVEVQRDNLKQQVETTEFDKDFDSDWNRSMADFAGSKEEREMYERKADQVEKKGDEKLAALGAELEDVEGKLDAMEATADKDFAEFRQVLEDVGETTSDEEFDAAMEKAFNQ